MTSSNEIVVIGLQKRILYINIKDILKQSVDKIKEKKLNQLSDYKYDDFSLVQSNPKFASLVSAASKELILIWDINVKREPDQLSALKHITSMSWQPTEGKILCTASDDNIILWDTNQKLKIGRIKTSGPVTKVEWFKQNNNYLASGHQDYVRIWDRRKTNQEVCVFHAHNSYVKNLDFDNICGKLILTSSGEYLKLFSYNYEDNKIQEQAWKTHSTQVNSANFLPFGNGIVTLEERANYLNFQYILEKDNGLILSKTTHLNQDQPETQNQHIKAYTLRQDPLTFNYQIFTALADKTLKITQIKRENLESFSQNQFKSLIKSYEDRDSQFQLKPIQLSHISDQNGSSSGPPTQCDLISKEMNQVKSFIHVKIFDTEFDPLNANTIQCVKVRIYLGDKILSLFIAFPSNYPEEKVNFHDGGQVMGMNESQVSLIINKVNSISEEAAMKGQPQLIKCFEAIKKILSFDPQGDRKFTDQLNEIDLEEKQEEQVEEKEEERIVNETQYFVPYMKTNGFAWNSQGNIVFFNHQKYNFKRFNDQPERKQIFTLQEIKNFTSNIFRKGHHWVKQRREEQVEDQENEMISSSSDDENLENIILTEGQEVDKSEESVDGEDDGKNEEENSSEDEFDEQIDFFTQKGNLLETEKPTQKKRKVKIYKRGNKNIHRLFHLQSKKFKSTQEQDYNIFKPSKSSIVSIFSLQHLFNLSKTMAQQWDQIFSIDIRELCTKNAIKCHENEKMELYEAWNLIGICLGGINTFPKINYWNSHPLGKGLAMKLLTKFEEQQDIQNLSLLGALILGSEAKIWRMLMSENEKKMKIQETKDKNNYGFTHFQLNSQPAIPRLLSKNSQKQIIYQEGKPKFEPSQISKHLLYNLQQSPGNIKKGRKLTKNKNKRSKNTSQKGSYNTAKYINNDYNNDDCFELNLHQVKRSKRRSIKHTRYDGEHKKRNRSIAKDDLQNSFEGDLEEYVPKSHRNSFKRTMSRGIITPDIKNRKPDLFVEECVEQLMEGNYQADYGPVTIEQFQEQNQVSNQIDTSTTQNTNTWEQKKKQNRIGNHLMTTDITFLQQQNKFFNLDQPQEDGLILSLIFKDDPNLSIALMHYMKKYSEILMSWGLEIPAIEMCKIVAQSEEIMEKLGSYQSFNFESGGELSPTSKLNKDQPKKFRDYLLFSALSLGFKCPKGSFQVNHQNAMIRNYGGCQQCLKMEDVCQICNLRVKTALVLCNICGHGGHYEHMKQWFDSQVGKEKIPCPSGCGCIYCFTFMIEK